MGTVQWKRPVFVAGLLLVAAALLFRQFFGFTVVSGDSMLPTLRPGDWLLYERGAYRDTLPLRGDIVIARHRNELIVKRIVGLPGEEIELRGGVLLVNGVELPEEWGRSGKLDVASGRLGEGRYATLGDNRSQPPNETVHPIIGRTQIVGKVAFPIRLSSR
jgi:signal peptidase I